MVKSQREPNVKNNWTSYRLYYEEPKQNVKKRKVRMVRHHLTRPVHSWMGHARVFLSNKGILRRKENGNKSKV